jgi:hypothetical protein
MNGGEGEGEERYLHKDRPTGKAKCHSRTEARLHIAETPFVHIPIGMGWTCLSA